jgi:membrane protein YqaA with SNARE-associated domain
MGSIRHWVEAIIASSGGVGLFVLAFLDSSFLPFPSLNDLVLINLSIKSPYWMPYYAAMATLGSLAGSTTLFLIARKGERVITAGTKKSYRAERVHGWMQRNGFVSLLIAAILPPPTPFKLFVFAAGALEMPLRTFVLAMAIARSARFFGEGLLAVRYGRSALRFLLEHKIAVTAGGVAFVIACYLIVRVVFREPPGQEPGAIGR